MEIVEKRKTEHLKCGAGGEYQQYDRKISREGRMLRRVDELPSLPRRRKRFVSLATAKADLDYKDIT